MDLDALVVAVGGAARVGDHAQTAAGGAQHGDRGVDVAGGADVLVDDRRPGGGDLDDGFAHQEPRHVEVVDHHVPEQAAGPPDVLQRRRCRIARRDLHQLDGADAAGVDLVAQAPERRVEPAVEPDHQRHPATGGGGHGPLPAGQVQVDGFLAEDRLARLRCLLDQVGVQVGGCGDEDAFDGGVGQDLPGRGGAGAGRLNHRRDRGLVRIGHRHQPRALGLRNGARVEPPDASGSQ